MRRIAVTTIGILMTMCAATAHADVVTDWNQIAIDMLKAANIAVNPLVAQHGDGECRDVRCDQHGSR